MKIYIWFFSFLIHQSLLAQLKWVAVDSINKNLPKSVQLYYSNDSLDGKPNIAYYIVADLKDKHLRFDVDTTMQRRLTPSQFYTKNNQPLVVVNGTFFSFETNRNLNVVIKNDRVVSHNIKTVQQKKKDSVIQIPINRSAIGISKKRTADIAWVVTDSNKVKAKAMQRLNKNLKKGANVWAAPLKKWKMQTAIGGGPVLLQNGQIEITNEEERMFAGRNGLIDKHPRTAMGYTADHKLIILVIQGRFPGIAEGASLPQEAKILKDLQCIEALNLDGGGSSCMLVNGKQTIQPSDKTGQRAVPAVFMIGMY